MKLHIRALREDADLPQRTVAHLLSIHQTTYSDYELGNLNMPVICFANRRIITT